MSGKGSSLSDRVEVTKKYAQVLRGRLHEGKGLILDQVVEVTGWNGDHARQQLVADLNQPPGMAVAAVAVVDRRKTRPCKYSYDTRKVL